MPKNNDAKFFFLDIFKVFWKKIEKKICIAKIYIYIYKNTYKSYDKKILNFLKVVIHINKYIYIVKIKKVKNQEGVFLSLLIYTSVCVQLCKINHMHFEKKKQNIIDITNYQRFQRTSIQC